MALPRKVIRLFSFVVVLFIVVYAAYYFAHDFAEQCSPALARKFLALAKPHNLTCLNIPLIG
jgi:CHASE3 domain sensor protein